MYIYIYIYKPDLGLICWDGPGCQPPFGSSPSQKVDSTSRTPPRTSVWGRIWGVECAYPLVVETPTSLGIERKFAELLLMRFRD
jgi:hypothetical protein